MVLVKKVFLNDSIPSARVANATCRECLWSIVEYISKSNTSRTSEVVESANDNDAAAIENVDEYEMLDVPVAFGTSRNKRRKIEGKDFESIHNSTYLEKSRNTDCKSNMNFLPRSKGDKFVIEHNIMMCLYEGDGLMYPCRILGNAPRNAAASGRGSGIPQCSTKPQTDPPVLVYFLPSPDNCFCISGNLRCFQIARSSKYLAAVPPEYDDMVRNMLEVERSVTVSLFCGKFAHKKINTVATYDDASVPPSEAEDTYVDEKYWDQRFRFFHKFDEGILLDRESWFSVTPEVIGKHIADRCEKGIEKCARLDQENLIFVDLFSGCGGNAIPMANVFPVILVNDIDASKIEKLRCNAVIYNVQNRFEYIVSDAYALLESFALSTTHKENQQSVDIECERDSKPIDCVLLAPPWGGSEYIHVKNYDLHTMVTSGDFFDLIEKTGKVAKNIICILPRNTQKAQLDEICSTVLTSGIENSTHFIRDFPCEVEDIYVRSKCKMTVAYFGPMFANNKGKKRKSKGNFEIVKTMKSEAASS